MTRYFKVQKKLEKTFFAQKSYSFPLTIRKKKRKIYDASKIKGEVQEVSFSQESAVKRAKQDLAHRLGVAESEIGVSSIAEKDFPNGALGALMKGEMAMQMISSGWQIDLKANGKNYEYRADKYQLRLRDFKGKNYVIES